MINNQPRRNKDSKSLNKFETHIINGLAELSSIFGQFGNNYPGSPLSQVNSLYYNERWNLISNNRALLSEMYVEHGIVQTLVDQPVDDAFRAGFTIKTEQISANQIENLQAAVEQHQDIAAVIQTLKWTRLYGGGATMIVTEQNPQTPLNYERINKNSLLAFKSADLWELFYAVDNIPDILPSDVPSYDYYGYPVNSTRVLPVRGKQAPSFIRPRLRGWGMSEIERLVRGFNQYLKNQNVIYELLDEAKIDVYKIKGFTQTLARANGAQAVSKRIQHANLLKNYNSALTMDKEDEYEQKQIAFTGLAEVLEQIRIQITSDVKMPVTKLFGMSAAGFSSGEDDIENYNSMIESEVRSKCKFIVVEVLKLRCQQLFGIMPTDLQIVWNPLRILSAEQEENVKDKKHKRILDTFKEGLMQDFEAKSAINKGDLLPIKIDEAAEAQLPFDDGGKDLSVNKKKELV